jgi:hypothetical protein
MVVKLTEDRPEKVRIVTGIDRTQYLFKTVVLANALINIVILSLIWYFFGLNFYSLLYLILAFMAVLATVAILTGFDRYSFIRIVCFLPSLMVTPNIIIIVGSGSHHFGREFSLLVAFSLLYILSMTLYEVLAIKKNPTFIKTAKKGLGKVDLNYYCKPEMSMNLLELSPIKRNSAWIRTGIIGLIQRLAIGVMILLLIASFLFKSAEDGYLVTWFFLSIAGVILGIMGRPMLVALSAEQVAVYYLQRELNSET